MTAAKFEARAMPTPRTLGQRVIIACEGLQTERQYFDGIRQHLRASVIEFVLVRHQGTDPATVVQAAEDKRHELRRGKRWLKGDTAWAVFDGEEHLGTHGDRQRWNDAVQRAESRDIGLAISNPSFELWYLLHLQEQNAALDRVQALAALRRHRPDYEKNRGLFQDLHVREGLTQVATARAASLCARCAEAGPERWRNPSTRVHLLVGHLLALRGARVEGGG